MTLARLAALALALCAGAAFAQEWPAKPIRLIVPFPPAGVTDILGRIAAERLGAQLRQPIVVENRPGASGHIGAQQVARAAPDGYTLMAGTIGIHAAYGTYRKLPYDPAAELQQILILGEAPNIVVVPAASPYRAFGDFLADVRASPGKVHNGTSGPGSSTHMVAVLFELQANARLSHVPYKGSGPALVDLISGQIAVMFENLSSSIGHVRSGKLRALAVTTAKRDPKLPEVPTIAEAGVPGYAASSWFTLAAPRGVPAEIIERLNRDAVRALSTPEAAAQFDAIGVTHTANTTAEAAAFFRSETAKWNRVIEAANLRLD